MTTVDANKIRNVVVIGHGGVGKTTLVESLLFNAKAISSRGIVEKGTTAMTSEPEEVAREGSTITPHIGYFIWEDYTVNIVDTPGYINFLEAARGVVPAVDGAVLVLSAVEGIKPEGERALSMVQEGKVPVIGFITELDKENASFTNVLEETKKILEKDVIPLSLPIGSGPNIEGVVDVLSKTAWKGKDKNHQKVDVPEDMLAEVDTYRTQLIEKAVETDDALLEQYLEGKEPEEKAFHAALRKAILTGGFIPVYCGSGLLNAGIQSLADGIVRCLPSPLDINSSKPLVGFDPGDKEREIIRNYSADEPFSGVVFKTVIDPFSGRLSIVRVLTGNLSGDSVVYNGTCRTKEKGGHLFRLQGKHTEKVTSLTAGDIGAIAKLDETTTGDTLCAVDSRVAYPKVKFTEPVLGYAVKAEGKGDDKVALGLSKLADEDPTLKFYRHEQTAEMIVAGMGQTHLRVTLERLERKFRAKALLQKPTIPYRETIRKKARVQGKLKKQTGGHGQFGDCWIQIDPLPRDKGFEFVDQIVGGVIPRQFIPSVEKGVREAMTRGVLAGFPVVDVKVFLVDGSHHTVDSSDHAFKVAGSMAFKKAMGEAAPLLLEPVMSLEIDIPEEYMGDVIKDLNSRRAKVSGMIPKGHSQQINAEVPMAEILEYGNILHALTAGRGLYTMSLSSYQEVPNHIASKVIDEATKAKEEEK